MENYPIPGRHAGSPLRRNLVGRFISIENELISGRHPEAIRKVALFLHVPPRHCEGDSPGISVCRLSGLLRGRVLGGNHDNRSLAWRTILSGETNNFCRKVGIFSVRRINFCGRSEYFRETNKRCLKVGIFQVRRTSFEKGRGDFNELKPPRSFCMQYRFIALRLFDCRTNSRPSNVRALPAL